MEGISKCKNCGKEFSWKRHHSQNPANHCCKKCWYEWNANKLASFNNNRFDWRKASKEEKLERLRMNFENKVIKKHGCWEWKGCFDKNGYGLLPSGYHKQDKAHRVSWKLYKGEIPIGLQVCHHCDNPKCSNPDHLFVGTSKDNARDMAEKFRGTCGSKNWNCKLCEDDVKTIIQRLQMGVTMTRIAKDFKVSVARISDIKNMKAWKHVGREWESA